MSSPPGERAGSDTSTSCRRCSCTARSCCTRFRAVHLSLFEWNGITLARFVGLSNYLDVVRDAGLRAAFGQRWC